MRSDASDMTEFDRQKQLLFAEVGGRGSGATRYGAAMYFYHQDKVTAEMLEIYRRCCKFDAEDPIDLAKFERINSNPTPNLKP